MTTTMASYTTNYFNEYSLNQRAYTYTYTNASECRHVYVVLNITGQVQLLNSLKLTTNSQVMGEVNE